MKSKFKSVEIDLLSSLNASTLRILVDGRIAHWRQILIQDTQFTSVQKVKVFNVQLYNVPRDIGLDNRSFSTYIVLLQSALRGNTTVGLCTKTSQTDLS